MKNNFESQILILNLLDRFKPVKDGGYTLPGELTDREYCALKHALELLQKSLDIPQDIQNEQVTIKPSIKEENKKLATLSDTPETKIEIHKESKREKNAQIANSPALPKNFTVLNTSVLKLSPPKSNTRVCLDFGTAMSKATLITEENDGYSSEDITVISLGIPGDQEEISENMLVSSVFIDDLGKIWFGQAAVHMSHIQPPDAHRQRLDNIKRYLSEEGLSNEVGKQFNPTENKITYEDMVLSYLSYFTWTMNQATSSQGIDRNVLRRFAMPCFNRMKHVQVVGKLKQLLGEAQILADTFTTQFASGIDLADFLNAIQQIRKENYKYNFIKEDITEPLGVAGSLISWEDNVNSLVMVIDIGAGTSDFSLYRMKYDDVTKKSVALEIKNSNRGITEAGNHLDKLLQGVILSKADIRPENPLYLNTFGALNLHLRDYKEALFRDGFISATLFNGDVIDINLDEFMDLPQVESFSNSLKGCMQEILNEISPSFVHGAPNNALAVALTGGGAQLPMVKVLANGTITAHGKTLNLIQTQEFPEWLKIEYPELENDYSRIAVSLGGARKNILQSTGPASITCDPVGEYKLATY
ncbi:hypothetical protein [Photobacterium damselae]|uniref:hypothetical protein n=1 Tax=Photobacterium damselae TaxID=38293 RepID=UPI001EFCAE9E|nr:hypothetical protein [Photobacterium damselae]MCG9778074.1 hypothetical protein [Photobacterium damselae]